MWHSRPLAVCFAEDEESISGRTSAALPPSQPGGCATFQLTLEVCDVIIQSPGKWRAELTMQNRISLTDVSDVLRGHVPDVRPLGEPSSHAAVAVMLRETDGGAVETLFIQRTEHPKDPWSGHMAFPGGRMDPADTSLDGVARRETFEEVGVTLEPDAALGRLSDIDGDYRRLGSLWVSPMVYVCQAEPTMSLNHEVADAVWIPLDYLANADNVRPYSPAGLQADGIFPSFQYGPYTIWGLTYRILSSFMSLFNINLPPHPTN